MLAILDAEGPRTFIFVITMGNHGPWPEDQGQIDPELRRLFGLGDFPQGGALLHYLTGLTRSDEMLGFLLEELGARRDNAVFGFYGDHLPSLPDAFEHLGFDDWASDYILVDGTVYRPRRLDLAAHMLPALILDQLRIRNLLGRSSRAPLLMR